MNKVTLAKYIEIRTSELFTRYDERCEIGDYYYAARAMEAINEVNRIPIYVDITIVGEGENERSDNP